MVIIGVLQQDDNKEKEKLKLPQSSSPAERENTKVIRKETFPIRSLTAYISEGNQLIYLARDWVIGLDEPCHTNYHTRTSLMRAMLFWKN